MVPQHNFSLRPPRCVTQALRQEICNREQKQLLFFFFFPLTFFLAPRLWFQKLWWRVGGGHSLFELRYNCLQREKENARVSDEMQQPDDSLVLVRFLISSANEQFDQAELEVCISGRACLCACVRFRNASETGASSAIPHRDGAE